MAQNQLNDLMEERVMPVVASIKGFFGSFGLSGGGEQPAAPQPPTGTSNSLASSSTPSRTRDSQPSSAAAVPPSRPPAPPDVPGRSGSQANGYQSDWGSSSRNKDTWNSSRSSKGDWESSSSDQRSPFQQTLLEVGAASGGGDSHTAGDASRTTAAVDIEEPDYAALSTEKLGRIQFSVSYDFDEQTLTVKIMRAEGLAAKDLSGTSDPYVKISLLPDKKHTLSTNIKRKNLNPRWNEVFAFEGFPYNKVVTKTLCLVVLDYDRFSRDDPIGEVCLPLGDLDLSAGQTMWKTLAPCKGSLGKLGMLLLSLCYQPTDNTITITIIKARDLKAKDINGLSDPYVKIWMMCDGKKAEKKKTEVKEKTLNPTFNDAFKFDVPYERIRQTSLVVSVMDYDRMGRNEAIGQLVLGTKSGPIEMKHWNEMFAKTRQPVTQWHILKDFD